MIVAQSASVTFRGCEATAPLKLCSLRLLDGFLPSFRGCEATAPLKQQLVGLARRVERAFRGCEATAPLKLRRAGRGRPHHEPSVAAKPRPH